MKCRFFKWVSSMYIFKIQTDKPEYEKYNGKQAWIPRNPVREDGFIEVYVPAYEEYILVRPSELVD